MKHVVKIMILIKQDFELDCNHRFLESLEVNDNIIEYGTGS